MLQIEPKWAKIKVLFLTASKYCGSSLKIDFVVVVVVILASKLLSNCNWTAFVNVINMFRKMLKYFQVYEVLIVSSRKYFIHL